MQKEVRKGGSSLDNEELVRMSESLKSAHKRIGTLEAKVEDLHALTVAVATVNTKVDDLNDSVDEIKTEVKKVAGGNITADFQDDFCILLDRKELL